MKAVAHRRCFRQADVREYAVVVVGKVGASPRSFPASSSEELLKQHGLRLGDGFAFHAALALGTASCVYVTAVRAVHLLAGLALHPVDDLPGKARRGTAGVGDDLLAVLIDEARQRGAGCVGTLGPGLAVVGG